MLIQQGGNSFSATNLNQFKSGYMQKNLTATMHFDSKKKVCIIFKS